MKCSPQCRNFPLDSFSNISYSYDKVGVKRSDKKLHICPITDKPITWKECNCFSTRLENKIGNQSYLTNLLNQNQ